MPEKEEEPKMLTLPINTRDPSDFEDLEIMRAYLRLKSIRRTARETERSRDEVRAAINRFQGALNRAVTN